MVGGGRGVTMSKASGGDGIPVELFQILKDDAVWAEGQGVEVHGKGDWCLQVKALRAPLPVA